MYCIAEVFFAFGEVGVVEGVSVDGVGPGFVHVGGFAVEVGDLLVGLVAGTGCGFLVVE